MDIVKGAGLKAAMFISGLRQCGLGAELGNSNLIRAACLGSSRGQENECHPEVTMLTKRWSWGKSSFRFKPVGGWFLGRTWGYRGVSLLLCPQVLEEKEQSGEKGAQVKWRLIVSTCDGHPHLHNHSGLPLPHPCIQLVTKAYWYPFVSSSQMSTCAYFSVACTLKKAPTVPFRDHCNGFPFDLSVPCLIILPHRPPPLPTPSVPHTSDWMFFLIHKSDPVVSPHTIFQQPLHRE